MSCQVLERFDGRLPAQQASVPSNPPGSDRDCHYKDGELVRGSPKVCTDPNYVRMRSMPPGCGLPKGRARPERCDYE